MLYYMLIYPYLYYGNIIWCSTYQTNLYRLKVLQKRIIRIITNSKYDAHTAPLFQELKLLRIDDIHQLQIGLFMYSVETKLLPNHFIKLFIKNSQIHGYSTRQSTCYRPVYCRTNVKQFTIASQGPKLWNLLPDKIKTATSISSFKYKYKMYLINSLITN